MKKLIVFLFAMLLCSFFSINVHNFAYGYSDGYQQIFKSKDTVSAFGKESNNAIKCSYNSKEIYLNINNPTNISKVRQNVNNMQFKNKIDVLDKVLNMGFSLDVALNYVFNISEQVDNLCKQLQVLPQDAKPIADNANNIYFKERVSGVKVDKQKLYRDIYNYLKYNKQVNIQTVPTYSTVTIKDIQNNYKLCSSFYTSFESSGPSRRENIKTACNAINGIIIKNGEEFSFNKATGERTEDKGYQQAKIIVNGKYTDGVGGGVCQVSTTLYNACLLAGLDVSEVHNHSLVASYVSPCFDAMVNTGSSDLKIVNNTGNDCIITASCNNSKCKVVIYGKPSEYKIARRYEVYQTLPQPEDKVEVNSDMSKGLESGRHQISYGSNGLKARGYLDYYKQGVLIKSKKIRDNTYSPKQGLVVIVP